MPYFQGVRVVPGLSRCGRLLAPVLCGSALLVFGCAAPIVRPAGVPDTPYWFVAADSTYWYLYAESLAVVQFARETAEDAVEDKLYELRRLGWRMTPERGPALQRAGQEQGLSQYLFQVARVDGAISPTTGRGAFVRRFWGGRDAAAQHFKGILPGLLAQGLPPVRYFYPSCLSVTWRDTQTASEVTAWLKGLGCSVLSSPQMAFQYYVQRTWVVELPAGAELFATLREFNDDPRVAAAYPVSSLMEPPAPDPRNPVLNLMGTESGKGASEPPDKWSMPLWRGYQVAHFAGFASVAGELAAVPVEGERFGVMVGVDAAPRSEDSLLIARYGGVLVGAGPRRLEAWIPFQRLPELAAEPRVLRLDASRR